jgi:serine/threonine protein kinase
LNAAVRQRPRLGNYEPLLELASGGMATVYVARQVGAAGFERLVVIKRVHRHHLGNREFYRMFLDEARVASLVRHPNVVSVIDTVEEGGELFLVMEYVESCALSTLLKTVAHEQDRLPPAIACRIMADTLAGLHAAHEATDMRGQRLELVHRDVSPQNVIIGVDGGSRLIDFGVAKAAHRLTETRSGSLKGKLAYMSPEQAMGKEVDRRVDLFAAGVALHEALTGRRLFQGENDLDTMRRITEMPVRDPSSIAPGVPRSLDVVVQRALVRDPNGRFQTAAEFLEALEGAIQTAPLREVAAYMHSKCGDRIDERRIRLKEIVEGQVQPLSLSLMAVSHDPSNESTVAPGRLAVDVEQTVTRSESSYSQISHIAASTRDASLPPALKRGPHMIWYVLGGAVTLFACALLVAGGQWYSRQRARQRADAIASAAASASSGGALKTDEIKLTVRADARIVDLRAAGAKRLEFDTEKLERDKGVLTVAPWTGTLPVEVVFEGGATLRLAFDAKGPRELRAFAAAAAVPVSGLPTSASTGGDKPDKPKAGTAPGGRTRPSQADPPGVKRPELQDNPY